MPEESETAFGYLVYRFHEVVVNLTPSQRIELAGRAVVDHDVVGSVRGGEPSG